MEDFRELSPEDVRDYWADEEKDFSPWLANPEKGLKHLEDVLNLKLEVVAKEKSVGNYNLDILAKEIEQEGNREIVIENQLQSSDHNHLGKAISYVAGEDADVLVWIAPKFSDEHLDAIQWLNRNSQREIDFFAIKVEVYTIGDSPPAVNLSAMEKPSEWQEKAQKSREELTELDELKQEFWSQLKERISERDTPFSERKANAQHWYPQSVGKTGLQMNFVIDSRKEKMFCEFLIQDDAEAYREIRSQKEEIEEKLGEDLLWQSPEETEADKDRGRMRIPIDADIYNTDEWEEYQKQLLGEGEQMYRVLQPKIQSL
jgi:hypothetical protein